MILEWRQQSRLLLLVLGILFLVEVGKKLVVLYLNRVLEIGERSRSWFSDETLTYSRVHKHNGLEGERQRGGSLVDKIQRFATGEAREFK